VMVLWVVNRMVMWRYRSGMNIGAFVR
jgi:hypothetical protein